MTRDPFAQDQLRREALMERVYAVRAALAEAHEKRDGAAALKALDELYRVVEAIPDAQVLYVSSGDTPSFVLPETGRLITARYSSLCSDCGESIRKGDLMLWDGRTRRAICSRCSAPAYAHEGSAR